MYKCFLSKEKKIKTMNSKMTTHSQVSTTKPKNENELSKQLEQNHRNGDHTEGYQWGEEESKMGEMGQGIRNIIGRYKIGEG